MGATPSLDPANLGRSLAQAGPLWVQTVEDVGCAFRCFGPHIRNGPVLCITSGGCTPLGLLLAGAPHVVAVDINPMQTDVCRLKLAALRSLDHEEFSELWLTRDRARRLALYAQASSASLGPEFDTWLYQVPDGVELVDAGAMQGHGAELRREHPHIYQVLWDWIDSGAPLDPSLFLDVASDIADRFKPRMERIFPPDKTPPPAFWEEMKGHFLARFEVLFAELPTAGNPYLAHLVLGTYPPSALPNYLRASSWEVLRGADTKLDLVTSDLTEAVESMDEGSLFGADISNVADVSSSTEWERLFAGLHRVLRPGAVVVHRKLLPSPPNPPATGFVRDAALSSSLHQQDRSFIYRAVMVDRRSP